MFFHKPYLKISLFFSCVSYLKISLWFVFFFFILVNLGNFLFLNWILFFLFSVQSVHQCEHPSSYTWETDTSVNATILNYNGMKKYSIFSFKIVCLLLAPLETWSWLIVIVHILQLFSIFSLGSSQGKKKTEFKRCFNF